MEISETVDHQPGLSAKIEAFIAAHALDLERNGTVVLSWRVRGGRRRGRYYRLTCREAKGRQASVYVPTECVEQTRAVLMQIQAPRHQVRRLANARTQLRALAAQARRETEKPLAMLGLYRKGTEIRGWSTLDLDTNGALSDSPKLTGESTRQ